MNEHGYILVGFDTSDNTSTPLALFKNFKAAKRYVKTYYGIPSRIKWIKVGDEATVLRDVPDTAFTDFIIRRVAYYD